jgi:catechol 2,3-dioxygenase-like lactoylglutathione lyase family enzyme
VSVQINGIAHIQISVNRFEECVAFYDQLMPFLGLKAVHRADNFVYYVGGRTGCAVSRAAPEFAGEPHDAMRPGLHHYCFRARSRKDVDDAYTLLQNLEATMIRAPEEGPWAPGYYSLSFLDPDGIRLEVNHVPGKGVLAEETSYEPAPDYPLTGKSRPR